MDGQMTTPDISSADLQAMIDSATDGPWEVMDDTGAWPPRWFVVPSDCHGTICELHANHGPDARLIAHARNLAIELINLRAANMALVAGQAKAHAAGYAQGVTEAAAIALSVSEDSHYHGESSVDSSSSIYQQGAFEAYEDIAALSPRGQDHAG